MEEQLKPKLSIPEQIKHMKDSGISFNLIKEDEAAKFITNNTYYFKIKAYCKNFDKNNLGQYINLDFAYLNELSVIDMHIRKLVLSLCINLEHSLRVLLQQHICANASEDGYQIVSEFKKLKPFEVKDNKYNADLINKYKNNLAIWNYLEIMTFGELIEFYKFYFYKYDENLYNKFGFIFCVKQLRNASAHSNCLLCNMRNKNITTNRELKNYLNKHKEFINVDLSKKLSVAILHDFAALLYSFNYFVKSEAMIKHTYNDLVCLMTRVSKNKIFFKQHAELLSNLNFLEKTVDFFKKEAYNISIEQKLY